MAAPILLAAEIGDGHRQADRFLPIAQGLAAAGRDVVVAMPPRMPARTRIAAAGLRIVDAPAWRADMPPGFLASCWADLLLVHGYVTPAAVTGLINGWREILRAEAPGLVVGDFAPSALLAARIDGIPFAPLGDGYTLPAAGDPMPFMRPWAALPAEPIHETEGRVIAALNPALAEAGAEPLGCVADILAGAASFLCTFPELDHYAERGEAEYRGEIPPAPAGQAPEWRPGTGERWFVVCDGHHRPLRPLVAALGRLGLPALVQANGLDDAATEALRLPSVNVVNHAVDRAMAFDQCSVVACQGNAVAAPALLARRPVLLMPGPVEQMMTVYRIARQGLGQALPPDADQAAADAAIRRFLDSPCRLQAANFARRYDGYEPAMAIDTIVEDCLSLTA